MRILFLSQYFTPEVTAARSRVHPFAELLAARGHEVEVICEVPNHPDGIVREEFRGKLTTTREMDGFRVRYVWVSASPTKTTRTRLQFYGSYAAAATIAGFAAARPDVVLVSSPPLPAAAAAAAVAKRHRVPWVMDVRDPWPEAAVALGELSNPRLIRALERLERRLYASATSIVTVTEPFREDIGRKSGTPEKVTVIPNGTTQAWIDAGGADVDRAEMDMPADRFVWTYAGNVGLAQGMEAAVAAARELGDGFQLQIVGQGPRLARVKELAAELPNGRVVFRGLVEPQVAARYLRASDASLVPLGAQAELAKFVPSKLFDCCAIGRPVILSAAGEPVRLASEAGAALSIPPEDPEALAGALRRLAGDEALRAGLAERGRAFATGYLRERQVERLELVLGAAAGRG